jgi:enoyl-CoA hydratase/carnithine racemase
MLSRRLGRSFSRCNHVAVRSYQTIKVDELDDGRLAVLTLNRPEKLNAMNTLMGEELAHFFKGCNAPETNVRALVVTGAPTPEGKPDAFCPGADLSERKGMTDNKWIEQHQVTARLILRSARVPCLYAHWQAPQIFQDMARSLRSVKCPTICAVDGVALGGGFEIALLCDWIMCSDTSRFGMPEVKVR